MAACIFSHKYSSSECEYNYDLNFVVLAAARSAQVHISEQNKELNVYNMLTAVIFLLNSREVHLMNAQDGNHQIPPCSMLQYTFF
jgi:hypothetical protein